MPFHHLLKTAATSITVFATLGAQHAENRAVGKARPNSPAYAFGQSLAWLKTKQNANGGWVASEGLPVGTVGLTSLALLSFSGDGQTLRKGAYKDLVKRGIIFLRKQQDGDGHFGPSDAKTSDLDHALATLAILEQQQLSDYKLLIKNARRGLAALQTGKSQDLRVLSIQVIIAATGSPKFDIARQLIATKVKAGLKLEREGRDTVCAHDTLQTLYAYAMLRLPRAEKGQLKAAQLRLIKHGPMIGAPDEPDPLDIYFMSLALYQVGDAQFGAFQRPFVRRLIKSQGKLGAWQPIKRDKKAKADIEAEMIYLTALRGLTLWSQNVISRIPVYKGKR